jgi:RHS repeat-associated protein
MKQKSKLFLMGLFLGALAGGVDSAYSQATTVGNPTGSGGTCDPSKSSCVPGSAPSTGGPRSCGPGAGGKPCGAGVDLGGGNPINIITGNKYQHEVDLPALPGVLGLEIVRHYNSNYSGHTIPTGIMGRGWKLSYEAELYAVGRTVQIVEADGTRTIFSRDPLDPSQCASPDPANGKVLIQKTARGEEYTWVWTNGRKLSFNNQGKLVQIQLPTGEFVSMQHDPKGHLLKVTDPQGRSLHLRYPHKELTKDNSHFKGVVAIDSPVGQFSYEYGSTPPKGATIDKIHLLANLVKVSFPSHYDSGNKQHADTGIGSSNISRIYHYEEPKFPTLLTGITIKGSGSDGKRVNQRIVTWAYDADGKAVLSVKGEPARWQTDKDGKPLQSAKLVEGTGIEQVMLDRTSPGKTILTNSLGQITRYSHAIIGGEYRLLEARGPGCATCGETNIRYGYDKLGRLTETTWLNEKGEPIRTRKMELDHLGRVARVSSTTYQGGKRGTEQWLLRYEYRADNPHPKLIARPSVVPGFELKTRIVYGDTVATRYLPVNISESGYIPTMDGKGAAEEISRTIRYSYNSYGQRIETDGPLKNARENPGPENSDIARVEYDPKTKLATRTIAPGNIVTEVIERDDALRPSKVRITDGSAMQIATIRTNWRGQPEEISIEASLLRNSQGKSASEKQLVPDSKLFRTLRYSYDANGWLTSVTLPGNLITHFKHDAAGRLTHRIMPDGSQVVMQQDTEGRTQSISGYADSSANLANALTTLRYQYDDLNRVSRIDDAQGPRSSYQYTSLGQVASVTNALGSETRFDYDGNGLLIARTQAANSPDAGTVKLAFDAHGQPTIITDANGVSTERRYDDFGRRIVEVNPDRGITLYRHDAAGRVIARIDETQSTTRYTYDHANRLTALGVDKVSNLIQYGYRGRLLMGVVSTIDGNPQHAIEQTQYQYNALGQVTQETRWIAKVDALPQSVEAQQVKVSDTAETIDISKVTGTLSGLTFITQTAYDDAGRIVKQILPDGHQLTYRYTPAEATGTWSGQQPTKSRPGQLYAILFDDRIVITDIEQTQTGGITGYTTGNGIRQQITLDGSGRIARLQGVTQPAASGWWQWLRARFGSGENVGGNIIYSQSNRYDQAGRLVEISRAKAGAMVGGRANVVTERYAYDRQDRLTEVQGSEGTSRIRYDRGGNRIAESLTPSRSGLIRTATAAGSSVGDERIYRYAPGTNQLVAISDGARTVPGASLQNIAVSKSSEEAAQLVRTAWLYHPTGVPLARMDFTQQEASNRIVYNSSKRPIAVYDAHNRLVARYYYNGRGERIAKTVYSDSSGLRKVAARNPQQQAPGATSYSLYREQRLAAEADGEGRITAHYVYLYGKPVAKIEMTPNAAISHQMWKATASLGGLIPQKGLDVEHRHAAVYSIHTDHLGTPQAVTDERRHVVWVAETTPFGQAKLVYAAASALNSGGKFEMNLRLPGQVYDMETGLHYNYYRDYDPRLGRYTTPDPMGLAGGLNPYAYVANSPLDNIDPLGLYEIDVHYYITYFLGLTAGLSEEEVLTVALAAQYVDDNPNTTPINLASPFTQAERLRRYHFTQSGYDHAKEPTENSLQYETSRIRNPTNPQLTRLLDAANNPNNRPCTRQQLFGEYLHAFEDTFGHRNMLNEPIDVNGGTGHSLYGHEPDKTYNGWVVLTLYPAAVGFWRVREDRTLQMEREVFAKIQDEFGVSAKSQKGATITFADIEGTLRQFNATQEDEHNTDSQNFNNDGNTKRRILSKALARLGLPDIPDYDVWTACQNRQKYTEGLKQQDYAGTILATPERCSTLRPH